MSVSTAGAWPLTSRHTALARSTLIGCANRHSSSNSAGGTIAGLPDQWQPGQDSKVPRKTCYHLSESTLGGFSRVVSKLTLPPGLTVILRCQVLNPDFSINIV